MYGTDTIESSWPVYCDHYHLYSFGYESITPQGDDTTDELTVNGWSMTGFPGLCDYTDWLSISSELAQKPPLLLPVINLPGPVVTMSNTNGTVPMMSTSRLYP